MNNLNEDIIQYIFHNKLYNSNDLKTTDGEGIRIINIGTKNYNSGPDYLNSVIKIGEVQLVGNIEIHINSSDWYKHNHQLNLSYNNVVLHVVYKYDKDVLINNIKLPTLELFSLVDSTLFTKYEELIASKKIAPCEKSIKTVPNLIINNWVDRMLIERLEAKATLVNGIFTDTNNNWQETFYQLLAYTFGFGINNQTFLKVAQLMPTTILAKHKNNLLQIEALLFGIAGFLDELHVDEYPKMLQNEFTFLQKKYGIIHKIQKHEWHFSKTHPSNFPTIRLAQFAKLIHQSTHLFSKIIEVNNSKEIYQLFQIEISEYWKTHYQFNKISNKNSYEIGRATIDLIIINTIVPILFLYSKNNEHIKEKALNLLLNCKAETNKIIKGWNLIGIETNNAYTTQALLHLKLNYCDKKSCLNCSIGNYLLKN